ncbi:DUF397 domain-containing protein [Streptomyces halstedii]|uniref:DUF397 domain-containing protein n=1 Tax=Streptomyces TaxID=1883 RepID=UPI0004A9158C|nr:DUF397 domain-containing protein [Streptomyces sp. NTK 937]KDQ66809.1 hypothetical protein DT87_06080 [Streptomyces sp. NTK 937]WSX38541.1 DUF397 domain-containing protein [Streptomyces halstedii]
MTDEARLAKMNTLRELLATDLTGAQWTKSQFSGGAPNDCLEATHVEGMGWVLRHSVLTDHLIPLTESEYSAYVAGVKAGQPGLVPGV